VLVYWGLFLCLALFLWGKVRDPSASSLLSACCAGLLIVFNFATFDFGCCSLAQEMSFVDCYLPYFRQRLITGLQSALLPFQSLFTENCYGDQLLALPSFSTVLTIPHPLCCVPFQFLVHYSVFFCVGWGSVCPGGYAGLSQGWLWEYHVMFVAHLLVCRMSPKQVWSWRLVAREPSCFLSVMWHREALYGLGVQGVKVLILLGAFFLPNVAPESRQDFSFMELMLSASAL
jgi:hypothetical protein